MLTNFKYMNLFIFINIILLNFFIFIYKSMLKCIILFQLLIQFTCVDLFSDGTFNGALYLLLSIFFIYVCILNKKQIKNFIWLFDLKFSYFARLRVWNFNFSRAFICKKGRAVSANQELVKRDSGGINRQFYIWKCRVRLC